MNKTRPKLKKDSFVKVFFYAFLLFFAISCTSTKNKLPNLETLKNKQLTRVVTLPLGAEVTGLFSYGNDLFMNLQHPQKTLVTPFNKGTVGVISNANFSAKEVRLPETADEKAIVLSSLGEYQILLQENDFNITGRIETLSGDLIKVSANPDFNAFVKTSDNKGFLYTNWEDRPGGMSRASLTRTTDSKWFVKNASMLDFSSVEGTWVNCFGTLSPWETPLSSEELYFDDTRNWNNQNYEDNAGVQDLAKYLGKYPNPYRYGYIVELENAKAESAEDVKPVKQFAMGRFSHENSVVMPDNRTVYLSDDGTGVVLFKFIADKAKDLSSGTLYAAKITQDGAPGSPSSEVALDIEWIKLAKGNRQTIENWIKNYDNISTDDYKEGENNYITDDEIAIWASGKANDDRVAFLESRKAAVAKGATGEFRKMEGININYDSAKDKSHPFMYVAISSVDKTMSDDKGSIQLAENKCGAVYAMELNKNYNTMRMVPVVVGKGYDKNNKPNVCSTNGIANPDNLIVLKDGTLVIGEDSSLHENNMLWIFK